MPSTTPILKVQKAPPSVSVLNEEMEAIHIYTSIILPRQTDHLTDTGLPSPLHLLFALSLSPTSLDSLRLTCF